MLYVLINEWEYSFSDINHYLLLLLLFLLLLLLLPPAIFMYSILHAHISVVKEIYRCISVAFLCHRYFYV